MTQALLAGWNEKKLVSFDQVFVTNRSQAKLKKVADQWGAQPLSDNLELLQKADVVVLATKPQDLDQLLDELSSSWEEHHIVISLAAGVSLRSLTRAIRLTSKILRVMPNTPIKLNRGVIGYCSTTGASHLGGLIEEMFLPLGLVFAADEGESFEALTVAASSGVGFVFELMQYWQEWLEEHGFGAEEAKNMTVQTFLGASEVANSMSQMTLEELQSQVASKKGVTEAGLKSMRELEVERALRYSFEKAVLRDRELGKN